MLVMVCTWSLSWLQLMTWWSRERQRNRMQRTAQWMGRGTLEAPRNTFTSGISRSSSTRRCSSLADSDRISTLQSTIQLRRTHTRRAALSQHGHEQDVSLCHASQFLHPFPCPSHWPTWACSPLHVDVRSHPPPQCKARGKDLEDCRWGSKGGRHMHTHAHRRLHCKTGVGVAL